MEGEFNVNPPAQEPAYPDEQSEHSALPPQQAPVPVVTQPEPERELLAWEAPSRPFKKRSREFYTTVAALVVLLSVILALAREFLLIGVIMSFGFFAYVLASVPPLKIGHRLTNKGVRSGQQLYLWQQMGRYWWDEKWGAKLLSIELPAQFPGRLQLLLGESNKKDLEEILSKYLIKQKPEPTWIDKASKWLQEKIPLESE